MNMNLTRDQKIKLWFSELKPHTDELKNSVKNVLLLALVLGFVNIFVAFWLLGLATSIYEVVSLEPYDTFLTLAFIDFVLTIAIIFPLAFYFFAKWAEPGIEDIKIFKSLKRFFVGSILLFYVGCGFGLFVFSPFLLNYFSEFSAGVGVQVLWSVNKLIGFFGFNAIVFGFLFQIPVINFGLIKYKIIKPVVLTKLSFLGIPFMLLFSGFVSGVDVVSYLLTTILIFSLFYGSILLAKIVYGGEK